MTFHHEDSKEHILDRINRIRGSETAKDTKITNKK